MHWKGGGVPPPPSPGPPAYAQPLSPLRQVPASMAFVTDSNRPQPLWQPPPTACLTASRAASEVPSLLMHPCPPAPPQTKLTIVEKTKSPRREVIRSSAVYRWKNLVGPFLVHKIFGPRPPRPLLKAPVKKMILQMNTPARTSQSWSRQTPAWTRSVHLDAPGQRQGQQPRLWDGRPPE